MGVEQVIHHQWWEYIVVGEILESIQGSWHGGMCHRSQNGKCMWNVWGVKQCIEVSVDHECWADRTLWAHRDKNDPVDVCVWDN